MGGLGKAGSYLGPRVRATLQTNDHVDFDHFNVGTFKWALPTEGQGGQEERDGGWRAPAGRKDIPPTP